MTGRKRAIIYFVIATMLMSSVATTASAGDHSFSSLVKHLERNHKAERQGTFGAISFARFLVKLIKPAGVKNFKVVLFRQVDFSSGPVPGTSEFQAKIHELVSAEWHPFVQYASRKSNQWVYAFVTSEKDDVKFLVVALQKENSFIAQVKFSPEKLARFMDDPQILGISLKDKNDRMDEQQKSESGEGKSNQ